jgi:hypothetical protein
VPYNLISTNSLNKLSISQEFSLSLLLSLGYDFFVLGVVNEEESRCLGGALSKHRGNPPTQPCLLPAVLLFTGAQKIYLRAGDGGLHFSRHKFGYCKKAITVWDFCAPLY